MSETNLYFIAALLDNDWTDKVRKLQNEMCFWFDVCRSLNAPPHVTLVPPFRASLDQEKDLLDIVATQEVEVLSISIGNVSRFGERVIFIDVANSKQLDGMQDGLLASVRELNIEVRVHDKFHPHITIGTKIPKDIFPKAWAFFKPQKFSDQIPVFGPKLLKHIDGRWKIVTDPLYKV